MSTLRDSLFGLIQQPVVGGRVRSKCPSLGRTNCKLMFTTGTFYMNIKRQFRRYDLPLPACPVKRILCPGIVPSPPVVALKTFSVLWPRLKFPPKSSTRCSLATNVSSTPALRNSPCIHVCGAPKVLIDIRDRTFRRTSVPSCCL